MARTAKPGKAAAKQKPAAKAPAKAASKTKEALKAVAKAPAKMAPKATKAVAEPKAHACACGDACDCGPNCDCKGQCGTSCACHENIDPSHYGSLLHCHLLRLMAQRKSLAVWVITFGMLVSVGSLLMSLPEAPRPLMFYIANHALTAAAFTLLFRLGFTGMGGLIEGAKLGMLVFTPLASLTIFLTLASIPSFMPLMGTGIVGAVLAAGSMYLLLGALIGLLCAWYLKPSRCCA